MGIHQPRLFHLPVRGWRPGGMYLDHCGRFPKNIFQLPNAVSPFRLNHLGWSRWEDRPEKYHRYMMMDPEGRYGWLAQYMSILDAKPNLVFWKENEESP